MRLHVLSDLHQEFGEIDVPEVACDAVILAGDVSTKQNGLRWIRKRFPRLPVIYVCGNHEYYGDKMPRLAESLRLAAKGTNVHFLENDALTLDGIHFFGATLWTDMALFGDWRMAAAEAGESMNDYKRIRNSARSFKKLSPHETRLAHFATLEALRRFFENHEARRSVVVTHHAPSARSLPEKRKPLLVSAAYASSLEDFVLQHQPRLWIHGHIHCYSDYQIGATRVLANPRGYPQEGGQGYIPDLVVEVTAHDAPVKIPGGV